MIDLHFKPLSNYIVLEVREKTDGNRIITINKDKLPRNRVRFIVIAVSEERDNEGRPFVKNVKVGDEILPDTSNFGMIVDIGKKEVLIVRETQIIGILESGYEDVKEENNLELVQSVN